MTTLAELLDGVSEEELDEFICANDMGAWAERRRGFTNAPFHWEWYDLIPKARRQAIIAPREHAKSEVFTINQSAWRAIYQAGIWIYVFAATGDLAKGLKERIDSAVEEVAPHLVTNAVSKSKTRTVYQNGSRVQVAGVGVAVRGAHPDVIIGDDVLTEEGCATEHQRKKTASWWLGTVGGMSHPGTTRRIRGRGRVSFPATQVYLVGTPFHQSDLLMGMRDNPLYAYRRYSAEADVTQLVAGTWAVDVA